MIRCIGAISLVCLGGVVFFASVVGAGEGPHPDLSTPRKAVQAFTDAILHNDLDKARACAWASDEQLEDAKYPVDFDEAAFRMDLAAAAKFPGAGSGAQTYAERWAQAKEITEGEKVSVEPGAFGSAFEVVRTEDGWKVDLRPRTLFTPRGEQFWQRLIKAVDETTRAIELDRYKTEEEAKSDANKKLNAVIAWKALVPESMEQPRAPRAARNGLTPGDRERAREHYDRAVARQETAAAAKSETDYRAAIDGYNSCVQLDSSNSDAFVRLGDCYAALQLFEQAKQAWDKAIEASPKAKQLLEDSNKKEAARYCYAAIRDLDELIKMEPNNAALYFRKANLYLMDHASESANENFRKASELEPTNFVYGMRAAHKVAPSKRQMTVEEMQGLAIGGVVTLLAAGLATAAMKDADRAKAERELHERNKKIVDASGGKKIECPRCNGHGFIEYYPALDRPNRDPFAEPVPYKIEQCKRCGGTGIADK